MVLLQSDIDRKKAPQGEYRLPTDPYTCYYQNSRDSSIDCVISRESLWDEKQGHVRGSNTHNNHNEY
jgi:hypothetical protein